MAERAGGSGATGGPVPMETALRRPEFSQCFGDKAALEELTDADLLTAIEFDQDGEYLATGDRGGRVVIFQKGDDIKHATPEGRQKWACKYRFYSEFQSHEPEFDYLKSLEIEEKINQIKWCRRTNGAHFLLSANDKTIKMWKIHERRVREPVPEPRQAGDMMPLGSRGSPIRRGIVSAMGSMGMIREEEEPAASMLIGSLSGAGVAGDAASAGSPALRVPLLQTTGSVVAATHKRAYPNAHVYHINSLSVNPDGETFISADDLRINLWNLEINNQSFNIVDLKPPNMDDLNEVITSASFHPSQCNVLMYSSSRGVVRVADLRASALCTSHAQVFDNHIEDPAERSFFSEIIASIADAKYARDGRYIFTRDYLTVKVWDTHMLGPGSLSGSSSSSSGAGGPVSVIQVNPSLRPHLSDLYETDAIFDKFECSVSGDGRHLATGTYNNVFQVHDREGTAGASTEVSRTIGRRRPGGALAAQAGRLLKNAGAGGVGGGRRGADGGGETVQTDRKILHLAWHPERDVLAIAGLNRLYFYTV